MLPSMPILFTRDSQDAFGNKIEPSTSFLNKNVKPVVQSEVSQNGCYLSIFLFEITNICSNIYRY